MQKNQKYTQEEMYIAIEIWKESGLSQRAYCAGNSISRSVFKYWLKKYNTDKGLQPKSTRFTDTPFIPIEVSSPLNPLIPVAPNRPVGLTQEAGISITYPNGIEVHCPLHTDIEKLKALIIL